MSNLYAEFLKKFPKQITLNYKCYIELSEGQDDCVWDKDKPGDCCEASTGTRKEHCEYWQQKDIDANYTAEELWDWIDEKLTPNP